MIFELSKEPLRGERSRGGVKEPVVLEKWKISVLPCSTTRLKLFKREEII